MIDWCKSCGTRLFVQMLDELRNIRMLMEEHTERLAKMDEEQKAHHADWLELSAKHDDAVLGLSRVVGDIATALATEAKEVPR